MPKALQKRGRRMKRKYEDEQPEDPLPETSNKRRKSNDESGDPQPDFMQLDTQDEGMSGAYPGAERAFFGMLDEDEQEYFKRADEMLELNQFGDADERALFLQSVYKEADGKELKIAQSQSCSRLLERLIRVSNAAQLKQLFQKFSGNFMHLLTHRFASHCCETLFTYAAPYVSEELKAKPSKLKQDDPDEIYVSLENLFLHTIAELEGNVGFLLTDRYASHALRILLLVLSGQPISTDSMKTLLGSKRKEGIRGASKEGQDATSKARPVPKSFSSALEKLIGDSVAGLDTAKLRGLATHPNANPTLQLLLTIELTHYGKQHAKEDKSILRTLLPDEPFAADTDSAAFISGLVYDPVGAHLVERIIENAPSKLFKSLYKTFFKERLASHAKNEVATYVVCRILERLGYDDLLEAHEILLPVVPDLLERHWTALPRTLIERCTVRDIDTQAIAAAIDDLFRGHDGFDISKFLKLDLTKSEAKSEEPATAAHNPHFTRPTEPTKVHFNIFAQAMLIVPGSLSALVLDALIQLSPATLLAMAKDHIVTRTLQQALTTKNASMIERRKLIHRFYGNIGEMALDKSASHVVDCIWEGTHGLAFIRERIAEELAENEGALRDSASGRAVWKNWKMDIYKRKRQEWIRQSKIKASNDGFQSFSELDRRGNNEASQEEAPQKTPLQLARERHVQAKAKQEKQDKKAAKQEAGPVKNESRSGRKSAGSSRPTRATSAAAAATAT